MIATNGFTLPVFAVLIAASCFVIFRASRRNATGSDFFTAGRSISGFQNGLAIAGDFMSAGTFLGTTGLLFLFGFDGGLIIVAALFGFLPLLFLLAERLRNAGALTLADVLSMRFDGRQVRAVTAVNTLVVSGMYLFAQLVGAGVLLQILAGWSFSTAVAVTGLLMTLYVAFGGMLGATWVMIIKAVILFFIGLLLCGLVLHHAGWSMARLSEIAAANSGKATAFLEPGLMLPGKSLRDVVDILSYATIYMLGTAGLPHVLIRFFTTRDGGAARRSLGWAMGVMGLFYLMLLVVGIGARAFLVGDIATAAGRGGGNLVTPILAGELAGGLQTVLGGIFLAVIAGVAFLTILAVVSGLLISSAGAVAHDLLAEVVLRRRSVSPRQEAVLARVTTAALGLAASVTTILIGPSFNITFLIGLAFLVAASANLPVLMCTLFWPRFSARGAMTGLLGGLVASLIVISLSPAVMGADAVIPLRFPGIVSMPVGILCCWLGTILGGRTADRTRFEHMQLRCELGVGAVEPAALH